MGGKGREGGIEGGKQGRRKEGGRERRRKGGKDEVEEGREGRRERVIAGLSIFSLRDNYEVTVKELDDIVSLVLEDQQQVYGCHLSGGGFGGSIVALLHRDVVETTKQRVMVG